jgi:hypothetical protein
LLAALVMVAQRVADHVGVIGDGGVELLVDVIRVVASRGRGDRCGELFERSVSVVEVVVGIVGEQATADLAGHLVIAD